MSTETAVAPPRSIIDPIRHAVGAIAAVCDGAQSDDGQGFDGQDAKFGARLVQLPAGQWTPEMARAAWEMLHKYRRQLDGFGIDVGALPEPDDAPEFKLRWARQDARLRLKDRERADKRLVELDADGGRFVISFPYDAALVELVRGFPGRTYNGQDKANRVPLTSARHVRRLVDEHGFRATDDAAGQLEAWADHEPPAATITVRIVSGSFHLAFPFDRDLNASAKTLPGVTFARRPEPGWAVPTVYVDEVIDWLEGKPYATDDAARAAFAEAAAARALRSASAATDADLPAGLLERLGRQPYPFQRAGIAYALQTRRTFIADEMGLGKSGQALVAIEGAEAFPAVVVCPASLTRNWQREAAAWLPHRTTQIVDGTAQQLTWADIIILSYDVLYAHVDLLARLGGATSGPAAVTFDESHYAKNPGARRTQAATTLAESVPDDGLIFNLTGTPVLNRSSELVPQLRILRRLPDLGGAEAFKKRYGRGQHLPELNARLRSTCYVRRLKKDVLTELPPKRWLDPIPVDPDPKAMAEYRRAEADIVAYVAARARTLAAELGEDPDSAAVAAALKAESAKHLVAISQLKQLAAKAKMPALREWVRQFTDSGVKLVLFGNHRSVVDGMADEFDAPRIHGDVTKDDRQSAVDRFQTDPAVGVIVCSIRAAGVGLTLTAASDVAFAEFGWTPGEMDQAIDRCHRIGQRESVTGWQLVAEGTIDEWIIELIAAKRAIVDAATDGDELPEGATGSVAGDLLVRLRDLGLR